MQAGDFLADLGGVLSLRLQLQILGVSFLGVLAILALLFRLAQAQPGFRQVGVPPGGLAKTPGGRLVAALFQV